MSCPDCEHYRLSAAMWRNEAYKHAGTPLPWNPEELLLKEYVRGQAAGAAAERVAFMETLDALHDSQDPNPMYQDGYNHALDNIMVFAKARGQMK